MNNQTNKEKQTYQDLIRLVKNKLKKTEGENYKGLLSIAVCLVGIYLKEYVKHSKECAYIQDKKRLLMEIEFLYYLGENYHQLNHPFDFEENYNKIDEELNPLRRRLFYKWIGGKFKKELERFERIGYQNLSLGQRYLYTLMQEFPIFKRSLIDDFKREIGLIK